MASKFGLKIDWDQISEFEGGQAEPLPDLPDAESDDDLGFGYRGYVPKTRQGKSGVTVGTGFDLGHRSFRTMQAMGMSNELARKLGDFSGVTDAKSPNLRDRARELLLTQEEVDEIDLVAKAEAIKTLRRSFKNHTKSPQNPHGLNLEDMSPAEQTALASVSFQYGGFRRTPSFIKAFREGSLQGAINELRNFGDDFPTRRNTEADILDEHFNRHLGGNETNINLANQEASMDPRKEANIRSLALSTGKTVDEVRQDLEGSEREFQFNLLIGSANAAPVTAQFVSDAGTLALVREDVPELTLFEHTLRKTGSLIGGAGKAIGGSLSGLAQLNRIAGANLMNAFKGGLYAIGADNLVKALDDFDVNNPIPWYLDPTQILSRPGGEIKKGADSISPDDPTFVEQVLGGVGQVAAQWAVAIASGGIAGTVSTVSLLGQGADQQADQIKKSIKDGKNIGDQEDIDLAIVLGASVTAVTERYGLNRMFNAIPKIARGKMIRILRGAGEEGAQELLEGLGQNLVHMGLIDPTSSVTEGVAEAANVGAAVGGLVQLAIPGKGGRYQAAKIKKGVDRAQAEVEKMTVVETSPDVAAEHRAEVIASSDMGPVQVSGQQIIEWVAKSEEETGDLLRKLGIAEQMESVLALPGSSVLISDKAMAREILGNKAYKQIAEDMRFHPNLPTAAEAANEVLAVAGVMQKLIKDGESGLEPVIAQRVSKLIAEAQSLKEGETVADVLDRAGPDLGQALDQLVDKVSEDTERLVKGGRIAALDTELGKKDQEIQDKTDEIEKAEAEGESTKRLSNRLDSLFAERAALEEEQADLEFAPNRAGLLPEEDIETTVPAKSVSAATVRVDRLRKLAVDTNRDIIKLVRKAVRDTKRDVLAAIKAAKTQGKAVAQPLHDLVNNSKLNKDTKKQLNTQISNTFKNLSSNPETRATQIENRLTKLEGKLLTAIETKRKAELSKSIGKMVTKFHTKLSGGKPVGNLTPAVSTLTDNLHKIMKRSTTKDMAQEQLDDRLAKLAIGITDDSAATAFENTLLQLKADPTKVSAETLENLLLEMDAIVDNAWRINKRQKMYRVIKEDDLRDRVLELLDSEPTKAKTKGQKQKDALRGRIWLGLNGAWWNKLQTVMTSSNADEVNRTIDDLSLFEESRVHERNKIQVTEKFEKMATEALGITPAQLQKKMLKDSEEQVNVGVFTHADHRDHKGRITKQGLRKQIQMSRAELRSRVMEMRNEDLKNLAKDPDTEGYTTEILQALEDALDTQDKQLINVQTQFYNEYYERINVVYENIYGVTLPKVENYIPIRREGSTDQVSEFLQSHLYRGGVVPGALKSRKPTKQRLKVRDDYATLQSHIVEMEYFIAYAEKVRLLNNVFGGKKGSAIWTRIDQTFGPDLVATMKNDLEWFSSRGAMTSSIIENAVVKLMRNFGFAQLGAKPQIGLKQLMSWSAMADGVPTKDFLSGMSAFMANPKAAIALMNESQFIQDRGNNIDQDYKSLISNANDGKLINFMGRNPSFLRAMMLPIKYGDKGAIMFGGYARVHALMKSGMSKEDALKSMSKQAVRTQQSTDPDQQSEMQRSTGFQRVFAQFMSSANALMRGEMSAIGEFNRGRIDQAELAQRLIRYHLVIPTLIQLATNGFSWDDEDQLRAVLFGAFNGMFIIGDFMELAYSYATAEEHPFDLEGRHPLQFANHLFKALGQISEEGLDDLFTLENLLDDSQAIAKAARGVGELTGIPIHTLINEFKGMQLAQDPGSEKEALALMLGWSPYIIEKNEIGQ